MISPSRARRSIRPATPISLAAALLLAGCAALNEPLVAQPTAAPSPEEAPTPSAPTATTTPPSAPTSEPPPTSPTGAPEGQPPPSGTTPTPPATTPPSPPPPAWSDVHFDHDFAQSPQTRTFTVPVGVGALHLVARFAARAPNQACSGGTSAITLFTPDGSQYGQARPVVLDTTGQDCGATFERTEALASGTWRVAFDGSGQVRGIVDVARA